MYYMYYMYYRIIDMVEVYYQRYTIRGVVYIAYPLIVIIRDKVYIHVDMPIRDRSHYSTVLD